ncbi:flagellar biosynthetic protein FliR [Herbaspirillum sp. CF444]|uniref:flagellar biosynthetic protein FliR n=1 Tax=Herbaspirillum sp. CF444 TaxID=1144319 RepID=UPI0002726EDF|nr:flagellar biosynthetic protein FliR [Herbaspirillum sp. CF444]EJL84173.1 flagellar biosynthetic protein FliR [Herbaspirillum sp. CF444]
MINFTSDQLAIWIASFIWPLTRILGLISIAPPFGSASVPMLVKILLGVMISLVIAPDVPIPPALDPMSITGLMILLQQLLIGLAMGFAVRLVFAAIEMAGELTSNTMGLGFAVFFDPQSQGRTSAISQLFSLLGTLVFLSINGHLVLVAVMADSFHTLPITAAPITAEGFHYLALSGTRIFSMGLQLSLPMLVALLITNVALGILTRAAPQLNLFGIGFPITMVAGFVLIAVCLPYMLTPMQHFLNDTVETVRMLGGMATIPPMPKH